jgi:hypothetical protein
MPKLSRYRRDCRSSQTSGAGHFDGPQATELKCDTAAGHHGHRSGYPAGEHQLPGPQALLLGGELVGQPCHRRGRVDHHGSAGRRHHTSPATRTTQPISPRSSTSLGRRVTGPR